MDVSCDLRKKFLSFYNLKIHVEVTDAKLLLQPPNTQLTLFQKLSLAKEVSKSKPSSRVPFAGVHDLHDYSFCIVVLTTFLPYMSSSSPLLSDISLSHSYWPYIYGP
ncbi:hypothetical protein AMTRI_Chr09g36830 [Amborella trichopoda]